MRKSYSGQEKMLVANPGQTTYTLITKKPCYIKPARNNAVIGSSSKCKQSMSTSISQPTCVSKTMAAVAAIPTRNGTSTLKTVSVRINRETDLLKHTVQKAFISKIPSHTLQPKSASPLPPTNTHRYPERTESLSADSLTTEMCHFKPIRTVPTTPNRRSKTDDMKIPSARLALKQNLDCEAPERPKPSLNLTPMILSASRISAFSYVALLHKTTTSIKNQKHKAKNKTSPACRKNNEENLVFGKRCMNKGDILIKPIGSILLDTEMKDEINSLTSDKHRTRRFLKTSTMGSIVEPHVANNEEEEKLRVKRKRQQVSENENNIQKKNSRITKDCSKCTESGKKRSSVNGSRRPNRRTPPVTRSRLKQSMVITRKQHQHQNK